MNESLPGGYGPERGSGFISVVRAAVTSVKIVGSGVVGGTGLENNFFYNFDEDRKYIFRRWIMVKKKVLHAKKKHCITSNGKIFEH